MNLYHKTVGGKAMAMLWLFFLTAVTCNAGGYTPRRPVHIAGGHRWGFPLVRRMLREFCEEYDVPVERFTGYVPGAALESDDCLSLL